MMRDVAEQREKDVQPELQADAHLQEDTKRRQEDSDEYAYDVHGSDWPSLRVEACVVCATGVQGRDASRRTASHAAAGSRNLCPFSSLAGKERTTPVPEPQEAIMSESSKPTTKPEDEDKRDQAVEDSMDASDPPSSNPGPRVDPMPMTTATTRR